VKVNVVPPLEPLISNSKFFLACLVKVNVVPSLEPLISNSKICFLYLIYLLVINE
jgi:hypothetical protein